MKRLMTYTGIAAVSLLALLLLAGCFWAPDGGTGSITMDLGSLRDAKTIDPAADTVRIYLQQESSGSYFAFEGTSLYIQEDLPAEAEGSRTLTIEGIPAGNWLLVVAAGKTVENGGFYPLNYGIAETNIAAGTDNPVTMTLEDQPPFEIATELVGEEVVGVVEYGGAVFALDAGNGNLYSGADIGSLSVTDLSTPLSDYTVYSIDKGFDNSPLGNPALWLNTDRGIVMYDGSFNTSFQSTEFPVRESGGYWDGANLYVYYRLPDGFGGTDYPGTWAKYDEFDEYFTGNLVRQFFVDELGGSTYAYFASSLGAFRVDSATIDTGGIEDFIIEADFFEVAADGSNVSIYGLDYMPTDRIALGTESGVFVGTLNASNVVTGVQRISNTEGIEFTRVAVSEDLAGTIYITALTADASIYLIKVVGTSFEIKEFPFYTGFPGGVSQMKFLPASSILYITGEGRDFASGGFAKVDVAAQF